MGFQFDWTSDFYLQDNLEPLTLCVSGSPDAAIPAAASMPAEYAELDPSGGAIDGAAFDSLSGRTGRGQLQDGHHDRRSTRFLLSWSRPASSSSHGQTASGGDQT